MPERRPQRVIGRPFRIFMTGCRALAPTRSRHNVSSVSRSARWTSEENDVILRLVVGTPNPNWAEVATFFPGKTAQQIAERWDKVLNPSLIKGSWTREEDETIIRFVQEKGTKDWTKLSSLLHGRIGKQCRERWRHHLDPEVNRTPWTEEEDRTLIDTIEKIGSKWVKIAEFLPGRSDNAIKNRWNSTLKKRLDCERNGADPPKRGRPSVRSMVDRTTKPFSADDIPKPPKFDDVAGAIRDLENPFGFHMSLAVATPKLLSPFCGLKSPLSMISPATMKDMAAIAWSPVNEFAGIDYSPRFSFSPARGSLKENREQFLSALSPMLPK
jgi:hypothetical protein